MNWTYLARSVLALVSETILRSFIVIDEAAGIFGGVVISMVQQAAKEYFSETYSEYKHTDVLGMQWQFIRLLFPSTAKLVIKNIHLGRASSAIMATVSQKGQDCMLGFVKYVCISTFTKVLVKC